MNIEVDEAALAELKRVALKEEQRRKLLGDIRHEMRHTGDYYSDDRRKAYTVALTGEEAQILDLNPNSAGELLLESLGDPEGRAPIKHLKVKYRVLPEAVST